MRTSCAEDDPWAGLMERRWFAINSSACRLKEECELLTEVLQMAETAWRDARSRLSELEAMRDALGEELSREDTFRCVPPKSLQCSLDSAA